MIIKQWLTGTRTVLHIIYQRSPVAIDRLQHVNQWSARVADDTHERNTRWLHDFTTYAAGAAEAGQGEGAEGLTRLRYW